MVLTRRASKCVLRWLPNELISEIIALASSDTQLALCRVCKLFNGLAVISLYRMVVLESYTRFAQFARSISSSQQNAIHVVSLTFRVLPHESDSDSEEEDVELPESYSIFNSLSRLETLCVYVPLGGRLCRGLFRDCTFPRLADFRYVASDSLMATGLLKRETLLSFIHRHPDLTRMLVMDSSPPPASTPEQKPSPLQKLRYFLGPVFLLDFLPPGISHIFLFSGDGDHPRTLERLSLVTAQGKDLVFSNILITHEPIAQTLRMIVKHLPRIVSIQLRWGRPGDRWLDPESVQTMSQCLEDLPALRYLSLQYIAFLDALESRDELAVGDYRADRQVVERWGKSCPSLRECCFHGHGWRRREEGASEWMLSEEWEMKELPQLDL